METDTWKQEEMRAGLCNISRHEKHYFSKMTTKAIAKKTQG